MSGQSLIPGVDMIRLERSRQVGSYSAVHDDQHQGGELALAAICYAAPQRIFIRSVNANGFHFVDPWPFDPGFDKRSGYGAMRCERIRDLVKAGALIAAEIDRLQRLSS